MAPSNLCVSQLVEEAIQAIEKVVELATLESIRVQYLGRKGLVTQLLKTLHTLEDSEKRSVGAQINQGKQAIQKAVDERKLAFEKLAMAKALAQERIDSTLPGKSSGIGTIHPVTRTIDRICDYFSHMGFKVAQGPEIEDDYHNFEALNIPKHHPARAMHDTFYVKKGSVLRTHTSPVQIRTMEKHIVDGGTSLPLAIVCPGKVYRCDSDQTHSPMFHQIEVLYVAEKVNFSHLKTILSLFLKAFFERDDLRIRFRPSYFPFTEPSAEVDIEWGVTESDRIKWLEVLGCGMVHPNVFKAVGIDPTKCSGFAFGLGVERFAMLRYGIGDLRQFFESDLRFLSQF